MNPDLPCPHLDFHADVEVNRVGTGDSPDGTSIWYDVAIRIRCSVCDEPFRWVGVKAGLSPRGPMCSVDETELRAPIRPASSDPDFGLGIPGFAIGYREAGQR